MYIAITFLIIIFSILTLILILSLCKSAAHYDSILENDYESYRSGDIEKEIAHSAIYEYGVEFLNVEIKYFTDKIDKIKKMEYGNWIDLRASEDITLEKGEFKLIPLGIAMKLPDGYEAHIVPRSSTFKNFGIIQTNHQGVVDSLYCGDNDQWFFPAYALRSTTIHRNDRICQFRIMKEMPPLKFKEVEHLGNIDRGGHGSTGIK